MQYSIVLLQCQVQHCTRQHSTPRPYFVIFLYALWSSRQAAAAMAEAHARPHAPRPPAVAASAWPSSGPWPRHALQAHAPGLARQDYRPRSFRVTASNGRALTTKYCTVQLHNAVLHSWWLSDCAVPCCSVLCCAILHRTITYCTVLCLLLQSLVGKNGEAGGAPGAAPPGSLSPAPHSSLYHTCTSLYRYCVCCYCRAWCGRMGTRRPRRGRPLCCLP